MKQRPGIVIFAGSAAGSTAELYRTQLDGREDLVGSVCIKGDEDASALQYAIETALRLFTAENLQRLVTKGLLEKIDLQTVPVLVVAQNSDVLVIKKAATALVDAAEDYPNLADKLRFTTLVVSDAELRAARETGTSFLKALDGLVTNDGIAFRNSVLLVCKEIRGAPIAALTIVPIITRVALLLTTFDYDRERSTFSDYWNSKIAGSGQAYFVGLSAYKIVSMRACANRLLYCECERRLLEILQRTPLSMWPDLYHNELVECASKSLGNIDLGVGLVYGSEKWIKLARQYRKYVVPRLLGQLLPKVRSITELRYVIESLQEHVRPPVDQQPITNCAVFPIGVALLLPRGNDWFLPTLATAVVCGGGFLAWRAWRRAPPPSLQPRTLPQQIPAPSIPNSPVFSSVLEELLERLAQPQLVNDTEQPQGVRETGSGPSPSGSAHGDPLPFCETIFDSDKSMAAIDAARHAVNNASIDVIRLLYMTTLHGHEWQSGEVLADITQLHDRAIKEIEEAITSDFIDSARTTERERCESGSIQDVLLAPTFQTKNFESFAFFGSGLKSPADISETCVVRNTINFLYLAE